MVLAALFFSINAAIVKHLAPTLPFTQTIFWRYFLGCLIITPVMIARKIPFVGKQRFNLFVRGVIGLTSTLFQYYAFTHMKLADASVLVNTTPIIVAVLSVVLLKEVVSKKLVVFTVMAFAGCALMVKPQFDVIDKSAVMALLSAACTSLVFITIKKLTRTERTETIMFNFFVIATVFSFLFFHHQFVALTRESLFYLGLIGITGVVGQFFMTKSYDKNEVTTITPYTYTGPMFAAFFGLIFWQEFPDMLSLIGAALIIVSGVSIAKMKLYPA